MGWTGRLVFTSALVCTVGPMDDEVEVAGPADSDAESPDFESDPDCEVDRLMRISRKLAAWNNVRLG